MKTKDIKEIAEGYKAVLLGEKKIVLDPVDKKAVKKDFDDREDKDIDNDGDADSTDKYLHNRRKKITKAVNKDSENVEESYQEVRTKYVNRLSSLASDVADAAKKLEKSSKDEDGRTTRDFKFIVRQMEDLHDTLVSADYDSVSLSDEGVKEAFSTIDAFINESVNYVQSIEQLDELSKKTLGSYIKKASTHAAVKGMQGGMNAYSGNRNTAHKQFAKSDRRLKGIKKATDRLTRAESVNRPVYKRILENRAQHYKGATAPEPIDSKWSGKAVEFAGLHGGLKGTDTGIDGVKAAADTARAAANSVGKGPVRRGDKDNMRDSMQKPVDTTKSGRGDTSQR